MSTTQLTLIGVKDTLTNLKKVSLAYRKGVMISLAGSLDNIRKTAAREFIIPRSASLGKERRPSRLRKLQPVHPTKLTERKGLLKKMLVEKAGLPGVRSWTGTKSGTIRMRLKLQTNALQGMVAVKKVGTSDEHYEGTLRVYVRSTAGLITARTVYFGDAGDRQKKRVITETKQTLFMRFMHERGIRGVRRPFMEPAGKKERFSTARLIDEKLNIVGRL